MARPQYTETICEVDTDDDNALKACGSIQVTVVDADTGDPATIWSHRTSTNPADQKANPFLTPMSGLIQFFADADSYKLSFHDTQAPARLGDFDVYWSPSPLDITPSAIGFDTGDIKISARETDHGTWLRMDGRQMTGAEIESALSLSNGAAENLVAFLGTGSGSKYGTATSGKIKLPDTRRRVPAMAGLAGDTTPAPPSGTTARALGDSGGAESVTLSAAQSGLPAHGHTASQAAHAHGASQAAHSHGGATAIGHIGNHDHTMKYSQNTQYGGGGTGDRAVLLWQGGTTRNPEGDPGVGNVGSVANDVGHTHSIAADTPAITVAAATPAVTVNAAIAAAASSSHENMPPFVTVGYMYIKL